MTPWWDFPHSDFYFDQYNVRIGVACLNTLSISESIIIVFSTCIQILWENMLEGELFCRVLKFLKKTGQINGSKVSLDCLVNFA